MYRKLAGLSVVALSAAAALAACGTSSPTAEPPPAGGPALGFTCGGFAGFRCPPASTCPSCSEPDCGTRCYATQKCSPSGPDTCPNGYACQVESGYCIPVKLCTSRGECGTQMCVGNGLSAKFCMTPTATPPTVCKGDECPYPWFCSGGTCVLSCIDGECPSPLKCVGSMCR